MDSDDEDFYYSSGGDWAEEAADASSDKEPDYSAATSHQKPYKILKEEDIKHLQENDISTVSAVLSVPRGVACSLLCRNSWILTSAYEEWFSAAADGGDTNPDPAVNNPAELGSSTKQICTICCEKSSPRKMFSAACGHLFCENCWKSYITTAISDGAACLTLRCPAHRCGSAVTSDMIERLASESDVSKYRQHLRRSYVESNRNRKWCPAPGCDRAVEFDAIDCDSYDVVCDCSHKFCWICAEERHRPVACEAVAEWQEKNRSEAENTNWILSNTKPCPKCQRPIQKNQGCNHMTCRAPCTFEFCWICCQPWRDHGDFGGDYFSCNKYKREKRGGNEEDKDRRSGKKAKKFIDRFTHYYERWNSNDNSRKVAMADLARARSRWTGRMMKFVVEAWEQIVECRRVLKWSYVYGYFLPEEEEEGKAALFEYLQGQAEAALERLHHCVEKEIKNEGVYDDDEEEFRKFRVKLVDLTLVTSKYFENLVVALENNLAEVGSSKTSPEKRRRSSENGKSEET